ncbi:MAG: hypothetical protein EU549_01440 [Promethearchaeota archaeon]|nr:MAG: hypothetical protein EU549_01440 [Candidatus Lokiarchaeota archaeon]
MNHSNLLNQIDTLNTMRIKEKFSFIRKACGKCCKGFPAYPLSRESPQSEIRDQSMDLTISKVKNRMFDFLEFRTLYLDPSTSEI